MVSPRPSVLLRSLVLAGCLALVACSSAHAPFLIKDPGTLGPGAGLSTVLGPGQPVNPRSGAPYRTYRMRLDEGEVIVVTATGAEFGPGLSLFTTDGALLLSSDAGPSKRATLARKIPRTADYLLVVSSQSSGEFGTVDIKVDTLAMAESVTGPGVYEGHLFGGGPVHYRTGGFMNVHTLELEEPAALVLNLKSTEFDAFLTLAQAGGDVIVAEDDDGGEGTNARLELRLDPGRYEIMAAALSAGVTGGYTLEIARSALERFGVVIESAPRLLLGGAAADVMATNRSPIPFSSKTGQPYRLDIEQSGLYELDMTSGELDAYLVLSDENGNILAEDDDSGVDANARIMRFLDTGRYVIWASSFADGVNGRYTVTARTFEPPPPFGDVAPGGIVEGTLTTSSGLCPRRQVPVVYYRLTVATPGSVQIDLVSTQFDTFLSLEHDSGEVIEVNDDGIPNSTNSRIAVQLEPGTYRVGVSTFGAAALGPFTLSVR